MTHNNTIYLRLCYIVLHDRYFNHPLLMADALITNHNEIWGPTASSLGVMQEYLGELLCCVNQAVKWEGRT